MDSPGDIAGTYAAYSRRPRPRPGSLDSDDFAWEIELKLKNNYSSSGAQPPFPDRSEAKWRDLG
ncbi:MAG: hypothetical protein QF357_12870, partial [Dehalococcoidia bacterium]|nr:hypothetical protein [Dehalococcoidia bacterium]